MDRDSLPPYACVFEFDSFDENARVLGLASLLCLAQVMFHGPLVRNVLIKLYGSLGRFARVRLRGSLLRDARVLGCGSLAHFARVPKFDC